MKATVALREHCHDESLTSALGSDLMGPPPPCQIIPQVCYKGIEKLTSNPLG